MRHLCVVLALVSAAVWGLFAISSYPIIVIADSDMGAGANRRVHDGAVMCLLSVGAAVLATRLIPIARLRIVSCAALLIALETMPMQSEVVRQVMRWPLILLVALTIAFHFNEAAERLIHHWPAWRRLFLVFLLPVLVLMSCWRICVLMGELPASLTSLSAWQEPMRTSTSLMKFRDGVREQCPLNGLRAVGGDDGALTLQNMIGGPALILPPAGVDRMIQVLSFSPDGKLLAAADNCRMYAGSVITIWKVSPGNSGNPPSATLVSTLRGPSHWTFSLDFFPDSQTLVAANGDNTIRLWDVYTGAELNRFVGHRDSNYQCDDLADCVATAADGHIFATWGSDGIKLWDRQSLRLVRLIRLRNSIGCSLAFTADTTQLIAADRECVRRFAVRPNPLTPMMLTAGVLALVGWMFWMSESVQLARGPGFPVQAA